MPEANNPGSAPAGNPGQAPLSTAGQATPGGQANQPGAIDYEKQYKELETRFGTQGNELGEYRTFFNNIAPLLEKLDQAPELVQAILDGKIDKELANAVYAGRVDVKDAATVQQAATQVQKEVGQKALEAMTPQQIEKLIEDKTQQIRKDLEEKADLDSFNERTQKFIADTQDFPTYAEEIDKWLDIHDVTDIQVAYYAVKGKLSEDAAKKAAEEAAGERAKEVVANASGGGVTAQFAPDGTRIVDHLIAGRPNPNIF